MLKLRLDTSYPTLSNENKTAFRRKLEWWRQMEESYREY
jgi:hypothetical protein